MLLLKHLGERNISWSKLSCYLRIVSRLCHDDAASSSHASDTGKESIRTVGRMPDEQYKLFLTRPDQPKKPKILRVSIIGEPNSGKSTLVNKLLGWRVNAVSSRVHTTRKNTSGVLTEGDTQIVFVDTPGVITAFQRKRHKCDPNMLTDPENSLDEVDAVGVVVDVANKWTRSELNKEVLKILYVHPDVFSFLILNKVDTLKKRNILLETTRRLTCGVVGGNEGIFPDKIRGKTKNTMIDMNEKYFTNLDQKYGKLKHKKKTSSTMFWEAYQKNMANVEDEETITLEIKTDDTRMKNTAVKSYVESSDKENDAVEYKNPDISDTYEKDISERIQGHDFNERLDEVTNMSNADITINTESNTEADETNRTDDDMSLETLEKSYQSDFLRQLRANANPTPTSTHIKKADIPDTSWTEKMERVREAMQAKGWSRFERVFMVSALNGEGTGDILNYLFDIAKPGQWEYNSSLVTPQHPYDIAKMCVWQCLLDNVPDWLPYSASPEIVFWHVDQYDRLDIVIEVVVDCQVQRFLGVGGQTVKTISNQARQALLDAFQCEISFKLMFRQKSRRAQKQQS